MTNIATVFKEEIRRLARREIRAAIHSTKRAASQYRRDIARLKRDVRLQQRAIARLAADNGRGEEPPAMADDESGPPRRFSARSVRAQRKRLKLSAAEFGKLIGVAGQTVYQWEQGKSRPRKSQFASLVAIRSYGRREALAHLSASKERGGHRGRKPSTLRRRKPK